MLDRVKFTNWYFSLNGRQIKGYEDFITAFNLLDKFLNNLDYEHYSNKSFHDAEKIEKILKEISELMNELYPFMQGR